MSKPGWTFVVLWVMLAAALHAQEPLTLERAVASALEKNPALQATREEARIARARTQQARAGWLPRIDFVQGFTRGNNPVYVFGTLLTQRRFTQANFQLSGLNAPVPLDNFQTRLEGAWRLFDGNQLRLRVAGAAKMETAAEYEAEQARQDLILRVLRAYYGVVVAREHLEAARESLRTAEANEQRVRTLAEAGMVVRSDLLSAQVFRAQMKEREIRAANAEQLARLALGHEMGRGPDHIPEPSEGLGEPAVEAMPVEEWEREALADRPALRAAALHAQAAAKGHALAKAEFGPRVGLVAHFERDAETLAGPSGTNWGVGARLEWNLFAGGANRYQAAEAAARERQAANRLEWLRSSVRLEVRQAYLEALAAQQRSVAARDAVEQARESLRIVQHRYEAGLTTITELLRAEAAQLDARTGFLAALHDWQTARAQLERAAGRLTRDSKLIRGRETP